MRLRASGPRPVDEAWERFSRPGLWPTWAPQIRRVATDADVVAPGVEGVVHGPLLVRVPFRVLAVDHAARRWTWRVGVGPVGVVMDHGVDPDPDGGSSAWLRVRLPLPLVAPYLPLVLLALRRLVAV